MNFSNQTTNRNKTEFNNLIPNSHTQTKLNQSTEQNPINKNVFKRNISSKILQSQLKNKSKEIDDSDLTVENLKHQQTNLNRYLKGSMINMSNNTNIPNKNSIISNNSSNLHSFQMKNVKFDSIKKCKVNIKPIGLGNVVDGSNISNVSNIITNSNSNFISDVKLPSTNLCNLNLNNKKYQLLNTNQSMSPLKDGGILPKPYNQRISLEKMKTKSTFLNINTSLSNGYPVRKGKTVIEMNTTSEQEQVSIEDNRQSNVHGLTNERLLYNNQVVLNHTSNIDTKDSSSHNSIKAKSSNKTSINSEGGVFNRKNIENPEDLHMYYVNMIQMNKDLKYKFDKEEKDVENNKSKSKDKRLK